MLIRTRQVSFAIVVALLTLAPTAAAQPSRADFAGGLSFASFDTGIEDFERQTGLGWDLNAHIPLSEVFGVSIDVAGHYGNFEGLSSLFGFPTAEPGFSTLHLLIGPRASMRQGRATLFGHALAGFLRSKLDAFEFLGITYPSESSSNFALGLGAGFDIAASDHLGIRLAQVDYIPVRDGAEDNGGWTHSVRVTAGIVLKIPR
jgi:hypothetical protein